VSNEGIWKRGWKRRKGKKERKSGERFRMGGGWRVRSREVGDHYFGDIASIDAPLQQGV
jgi:hypothetical protein